MTHACVRNVLASRSSLPPFPRSCLRVLRHAAQVLKELIRAGAQLDLKEADGFMAIHYAADAGNVPALRELILAGSSHDWRDDGGKTPLALACYHGHVASVVYLLDKAKANPGVVDNTMYTPLSTACQQGHLLVVKVLLKCGVRQLGPNSYLDGLCSAAVLGNFPVMRELINAEGGVHVRGSKTRFAPMVTPLHYAAAYCHPFAMSLLLEAGADETDVDSSGNTPSDVVDTLRDEHMEHGFGRQQARRMLRQAPAYRARSWKWPDTSAVLADPAAAAGPAKNVPQETSVEAGARSAKAEPKPAKMTAENFDCAFDAAMSFAAAPSVAAKVDTTIYRRPAISSSGSSADGRSAAVASLIRYTIDARSLSLKPVNRFFC